MGERSADSGPRSKVSVSGGSALTSLWIALTLCAALLTHVGAFKMDPVFGRLNARLDLTGVLVVAVAGIGVIATLVRGKVPRPTSLDIVVTLIALVMLIGVGGTTDGYASVKMLTFVAVSIPLYLAGRILPSQVSARYTPGSLMSIGIYVGVTGLLFGTWDSGLIGARLVQGAGSHYLSLGYVSGSTALLAWIWQYQKMKGSSRLVLQLAFALSFLVLILSAARGPLAAFIGASVAYEYLVWHSHRKAITGFAFLGGLMLLVSRSSVGAPMSARISGLMTQEGTMSLGGRGVLYEAAAKSIMSMPFGIGTGNFSSLVGTTGRNYPHNLVLELGCENGWVGLTLGLFFVAMNARNAVRLVREGKNVPAAALLIFSLIGAMMSGDVNDQRLLWFASGAVQRHTCVR